MPLGLAALDVVDADPQKGGKSSVYFTGPELRSVDNVEAALDSLGL